MPFVKGKSGNPAGRPRGIIDRRMRLNKSLMEDADALLAVAKAKALEGDPQMLNFLLSRVMPALRAEGTAIQFEFDPGASPSAQVEAITAAVASGQITLEQGRHFADMVRQLAEVKALDGQGDKADKLVQAFRDMAANLPV